MVTSPTEKGIVVIGGEIDEDFELQKGSSNALLELSRNSKGDLSWTILEQNLKFPISHHVFLCSGSDGYSFELYEII